eukprot:8466709-Prorocentrum_lima.AAC.1
MFLDVVVEVVQERVVMHQRPYLEVMLNEKGSRQKWDHYSGRPRKPDHMKHVYDRRSRDQH